MITLKTRKEIIIRSGNLCEFCRSPGGFFGLQFAHITHRKIGGRHGEMKKIINDKRNIAHLCQFCHDVLDNRAIFPIRQEEILRKLKKRIGWHDWAKENNILGDTQGE